MHVIVVGAGIIGVSTAYYLNAAGCQVTVLERHSGVAQEASFGNAGVIAPGYVTPWAAPGMPKKVLASLFEKDAPIVFRPNLDPRLWLWAIRWLGQCTPERYRVNRERMQRLAFYSRIQLHALREEHELQYEQSEGLLQLFRSERDLELAQPGLEMLKAAGVRHTLFSAAQCREVEPGLSENPLVAGLHLPDDESGNCPLFARLLRDLSAARGVTYSFGARVLGIESAASGVVVATEHLRLPADAVVLATGVDSARLLRPLGMRVPLYPVKGYSATVTIREPTYAPLHALMDEAYKVAITRMGQRIRIAGTAELGRRDLKPREAALATLIKVARDWFPGAADYSRATYWTGARPMLPDGPPLLGTSRVPRVWLNLGHGSTGWAMAAGSGRILADLVTGKVPEIALDGLTIARYA
jgi:D-amino-acid dehydrogenase